MFAKINRRSLASDAGSVDFETVGMGAIFTLMGLVVVGIVGLIVWLIVAAVNTPSAGTIEAKHFEPAHTITVCHLVGKVTVCSPQYYGDEWEFDIKNEKENKEGWVTVSEGSYGSYQIGDWYDTKQG